VTGHPVAEVEAAGLGRASRPSPHRAVIVLAVVIAVLFVATSVAVLGARRATAPGGTITDAPARAVRDGRIAPGFTVPRLAAPGSVSLAAFSGHVLVMSFWASWCPPCRQEAAPLLAAWRTFRPLGVRFLLVDHRDRPTAGLASVRREDIPFAAASDPGGEIATRYGLFGIPTTLVIRPDGRIAFRILGRVDGTNLSDAIDAVIHRG
jgi:peroxiredoxin